MPAGFVYLIRAENGLVKIGCSGHPAKRVRELAIGPLAVELFHQIATDDMAWLEGQLHHRHREKRSRGEWFRLEENDLLELRAMGACNRGDLAGVVCPQVPFRPDKPDLIRALEAYASSVRLSRNMAIQLILKDLLTREGFWPPKAAI
jgi:hypothetical protein